jgi:hypothetical protein
MMPALVSTRIGLLNPNSAMLAAICATCASEWVRGFRAYGISFSRAQCSIALHHRLQKHASPFDMKSGGAFRRVRSALACRTEPLLIIVRRRPACWKVHRHAIP